MPPVTCVTGGRLLSSSRSQGWKTYKNCSVSGPARELEIPSSNSVTGRGTACEIVRFTIGSCQSVFNAKRSLEAETRTGNGLAPLAPGLPPGTRGFDPRSEALMKLLLHGILVLPRIESQVQVLQNLQWPLSAWHVEVALNIATKAMLRSDQSTTHMMAILSQNIQLLQLFQSDTQYSISGCA